MKVTAASSLGHGDVVYIGADEGWTGSVLGTHPIGDDKVLVAMVVPANALFVALDEKEGSC